MTTKEAAKKVRELVEAAEFFLQTMKDLDAHTCPACEKVKAAVTDARKAVNVLANRFP